LPARQAKVVGSSVASEMRPMAQRAERLFRDTVAEGERCDLAALGVPDQEPRRLALAIAAVAHRGREAVQVEDGVFLELQTGCSKAASAPGEAPCLHHVGVGGDPVDEIAVFLAHGGLACRPRVSTPDGATPRSAGPRSVFAEAG